MTDQKTINDIVWRACDTFRGTVDPSQYKDYILVMLFVKYLSDLRKEKVEEYSKRYGGDMDRVGRAMARERFVLPEECDFEHLFAMRGEGNIGERINIALQKIEDANKSKLEGVFRNIDFNSESNLGETKERNSRLKHMLEDFADEPQKRLDLRPSKVGTRDVIGDVYEYLIGNFASDAGKKGGEFYTPAEVSRLLARIVAPKAGDRICDPCCGSGSLLIRAAREVGSDNFSAFGQELNGSTWALCRMNMFLHGLDTARIERGDTIRNPKLVEDDALMKFNVVVANPPFSLDKWGADTAESDKFKRFWRGTPPKSRGDYAFITHMVETMNETDGRVGVVVPHGVLFRGGSEGTVRQRFIEENLLEGVIGLPANLFFGVGIPAALLFFRRDKTDTIVFFIDASREYAEGKNQNKLRDEDLEKIVRTWRARTEVPKYAHLATPEELAENDYNLNIPLYVDTFEEEAPIDLVKIKKQIGDIERDLATTRAKLAAALQELGVS
jgi:type I restriction enzyme M protein